MPELVRWGYQRPLGKWPLRLPCDVYSLDEYLIDQDAGVPTALCHEVALCAETDNPFREASRQMSAMAGLAAERNQAAAFSTMRGVLAAHPVLTNKLLNEVRFTNSLGTLDEYLGVFYRPIGLEYQLDGAVHPCANCGTPLRPAAEQSWWCEREECRSGQAVSPGKALDWDAEILIQGSRRHRQFVSGPDRAAQRIASGLELPGVRVRLWPVHGPGDLLVDVPGEHTWTVMVVDWHSPALLGKAIAAAVDRHGTDSAAWVVAQHRTRADPGYLEIVRRHAAMADGKPQVRDEEGFTAMVRRRSEGSEHA